MKFTFSNMANKFNKETAIINNKINTNELLMEKIIDFWNFYKDTLDIAVLPKEEEYIAERIHDIQAILCTKELMNVKPEFFK